MSSSNSSWLVGSSNSKSSNRSLSRSNRNNSSRWEAVTNELPAATEKLPFPLPVDVSWHTVIDLTGDAEETLTAALDSGETVLALRIASWDDVQALADYQYMLTKPVCFVCDDTQLLEAALRAYQGRALYDGDLPEDTLLPLCAKYGLLL